MTVATCQHPFRFPCEQLDPLMLWKWKGCDQAIKMLKTLNAHPLHSRPPVEVAILRWIRIPVAGIVGSTQSSSNLVSCKSLTAGEFVKRAPEGRIITTRL